MNLNQVTIPSLNVEKATRFYKTLGLKLIVNALPKYVRFECPDGSATFSIHKVDHIMPEHGISIYFEEEHLDTWVHNLQKKGIEFKELPNDKPWLWREARLLDPDGNHIILYHAGENRKNPPWRIH
ncbi:VOC family protein [Tamlana fucoidanivorans]|uniref:VOC family protein n=1 Tax=Allotamlana fucoidanivorans TaxID=2583814 RepID=A0A5C4SGU5_9FLAO|nr:VOC family protein [Tamlana fucoidanivorans]TNJ42859.1 VOC family protein [Tamlana fucoidanivorans]